jgi:hypothetical protein
LANRGHHLGQWADRLAMDLLKTMVKSISEEIMTAAIIYKSGCGFVAFQK